MIRKPKFAGTFYPDKKEELSSLVKDYLEKGKEVKFSGRLKALIVPHAAYNYSGIVAGAGFKLLKGKKFKKVILIGPTHNFYYRGAALAPEDFETPLGIVKVGDLTVWSKEEQMKASKDVHSTEHSIEVELPFLQETLGEDFELYALAIGEAGEERLAKTLLRFVDSETIVVVSSDLSHYYGYDYANQLDKKTMDQILRLDFTEEMEACGKKAILVLMHLARKLGWKPFLIDYKNSGDTSKNKAKVVGYAAIGFSE